MSSIVPRPEAAPEGGTQGHPTSVYRYYDSSGVLIYVGITKQGMGRNLQHNGRAEWWQYVVRQEVEHFPTRPKAAAREKELIQRHRPPFNKQHNPWQSEVREAYLDFRAAEIPDEDAYSQFLRLGKSMPLDVVEYVPEAQHLVLRTDIKFASLATRLRLTKQVTPLRGTRKIGWIRELANVGPFTYFNCLVNKYAPPTVAPVRAIIGWQQVEKPHFPYVRHVLCDLEAISHIANGAVRI